MDIAEINKKLSVKVAKATGFEKNNKINEAIREWVSVSEIALRILKIPDLNFSFKSMLLEKTEQIINHIKELKYKVRKEEIFLQDDLIPTEPVNMSEELKKQEENINSSEPEILEQTPESVEEQFSKVQEEMNVIDKNEYRNLPEGFKQVEAPKDFKIITPHDKDYILKILNTEHDTEEPKSEIKVDDSNIPNPEKHKINPKLSDITKDFFCFACGKGVSKEEKICSSCGADLSKE